MRRMRAQAARNVPGRSSSGEELRDLVALDELPDVVPVGVAEQVRDRPSPALLGAVGEQVTELAGGERRVGKKVERFAAVEVGTIGARGLHLAGSIALPRARKRLTLRRRSARFFVRPGGHNSVGRVSASQAESRGFESRCPLQLASPRQLIAPPLRLSLELGKRRPRSVAPERAQVARQRSLDGKRLAGHRVRGAPGARRGARGARSPRRRTRLPRAAAVELGSPTSGWPRCFEVDADLVGATGVEVELEQRDPARRPRARASRCVAGSPAATHGHPLPLDAGGGRSAASISPAAGSRHSVRRSPR